MSDVGPVRWCVLFLALCLSCRRSRAPGSSEAERSTPSPPFVEPAALASSAFHSASRAHGVSVAPPGAPPVPSGAGSSEPVGGRWVSCYANYRPTSSPERDLARLAGACGPQNGMVAVGPAVSGAAVDAAEDHRFEARAGDCFRIYAVADGFVGDLGVEVINPRGKAVTYDRNGDRWPILNPDGPFCLFEAGTYTVRVRALQGKGRYAMQVWRLP